MDKQAHRKGNIVYGPRRDVSIETRGVGRAVFNKIKEYGRKTMQIDANTGTEETYEEVNKKLIRMALEMQRRGIKPGDIILTCSYNSMDAILPVYSTLYLNATTVTLDPMISLRDSTHLINAISPKLIFVVPEAIALIEGAIANLKEAPGIVVMGSHNKYATLSEFLKP
ncbi:AMP-binding protein, partial [Oryctes borbonicus]